MDACSGPPTEAYDIWWVLQINSGSSHLFRCPWTSSSEILAQQFTTYLSTKGGSTYLFAGTFIAERGANGFYGNVLFHLLFSNAKEYSDLSMYSTCFLIAFATAIGWFVYCQICYWHFWFRRIPLQKEFNWISAWNCSVLLCKMARRHSDWNEGSSRSIFGGSDYCLGCIREGDFTKCSRTDGSSQCCWKTGKRFVNRKRLLHCLEWSNFVDILRPTRRREKERMFFVLIIRLIHQLLRTQTSNVNIVPPNKTPLTPFTRTPTVSDLMLLLLLLYYHILFY